MISKKNNTRKISNITDIYASAHGIANNKMVQKVPGLTEMKAPVLLGVPGLQPL